MIYPAVKKYSESNKKYLIPMAIGAGSGVGLRYLVQNSSKYRDRMSPEAKTTGLIGGAIGGAGLGLSVAGGFNPKDNRTLIGLPLNVGGIYALTRSNNQIKEEVKKQSISDAVYLPLIGGASSSAVGLYNTKFGSMKDMPDYNKRNYLLGSALVGAGSGLALSDAHPVLRGTGFLSGVTGMELARRAQFGPRVGEISNVAGDGSSTVAAVNGSGI